MYTLCVCTPFFRFCNFVRSSLTFFTVPNGRMPDDIMENMKDSLPEKDFNGAKTLPSDSQSSGSRIVTSQGSRSSTTTITQSKSLVRIGWQQVPYGPHSEKSCLRCFRPVHA